MEAQEVVLIQPNARSRGIEFEASMGTVEVVVVQPQWELLFPLQGVLIGTSVSPLAQGSLDEAFGFSVGAGSVDTGEALPDVPLVQDFAE